MVQLNALSALLESDISDPTDFPDNNEAPGLRKLDSSTRCSICSEWFDAPVTLPCGHCFCSLCARSYLSEKAECPGCRAPANEGHLRPNPTAEDVVEAWKLARPHILKLLEFRKLESAAPSARSHPNTRPHKKRKRSRSQDSPTIADSSGGEIECIAGPSNQVTPSKSKSKPKRRISPAEDDTDHDGQPIIPTSDSVEELIDDEPASEIVGCPLCSRRVKLETINAHMDNNCQEPKSSFRVSGQTGEKNPVPMPVRSKSNEEAKGAWSKLMGGGANGKRKTEGTMKESEPLDRLPKVSYAVLKDRQIRELLQEEKLSTNGDRSTLESRHARWVMIFNANLDKSQAQRKPVVELRADLRKWEEQERSNAKRKEKTLSAVGNLTEHQRTHKSDFDRLIQAARSSSHKNTLDKPSSSAGGGVTQDAANTTAETTFPE